MFPEQYPSFLHSSLISFIQTRRLPVLLQNASSPAIGRTDITPILNTQPAFWPDKLTVWVASALTRGRSYGPSSKFIPTVYRCTADVFDNRRNMHTDYSCRLTRQPFFFVSAQRFQLLSFSSAIRASPVTMVGFLLAVVSPLASLRVWERGSKADGSCCHVRGSAKPFAIRKLQIGMGPGLPPIVWRLTSVEGGGGSLSAIVQMGDPVLNVCFSCLSARQGSGASWRLSVRGLCQLDTLFLWTPPMLAAEVDKWDSPTSANWWRYRRRPLICKRKSCGIPSAEGENRAAAAKHTVPFTS